MEFVVGILLLLTFFGLAYYCIKGHNLMIGFLIITILWTALSFLGAAFASPEFLSTTAFYSNGEPVKAIAVMCHQHLGFITRDADHLRRLYPQYFYENEKSEDLNF